MSVSEAPSVPFYTLIKLCYTQALEGSNLSPGPEAKSLEITNLTSFTFSYHLDPDKIKWNTTQNNGGHLELSFLV